MTNHVTYFCDRLTELAFYNLVCVSDNFSEHVHGVRFGPLSKTLAVKECTYFERLFFVMDIPHMSL